MRINLLSNYCTRFPPQPSRHTCCCEYGPAAPPFTNLYKCKQCASKVMPRARASSLGVPSRVSPRPAGRMFSHLVLFGAQIGDAWPIIASCSGRATMRALSHGPLTRPPVRASAAVKRILMVREGGGNSFCNGPLLVGAGGRSGKVSNSEMRKSFVVQDDLRSGDEPFPL